MNDNIQYIDDYISRALNEEEMGEFDKMREKDPKLESEYQILAKSREFLKARAMIHEIENDPDLPFAEKMVNEFFQKEEDTAKRRSMIRKIIYISIPAAVMAGLILLFSFLQNTNTLTRLYSHYYTPLHSEEIQNFIVRDVPDQHLSQGFIFYLDGDYQQAIFMFKQTENSEYFLGLCYLGINDFEQARFVLEEFYQGNKYHSGANWYLGLTYLKLSNPLKAREHMKKLFLGDNPYQNIASRIIRKLDKYIAAGGG